MTCVILYDNIILGAFIRLPIFLNYNSFVRKLSGRNYVLLIIIIK